VTTRKENLLNAARGGAGAALVLPYLPGKRPVTLRDHVLTGDAFDVRASQNPHEPTSAAGLQAD
jgi:hypothetical protein